MALLILAACSGTGKSTLVKALLARHPRLSLSVSHTTRAPRPGEEDGVAYHFITREAFEALAAQGAFVESAEYAGNLYGTSHAEVERAEREGRDLLFEVEVVGAAALKASYPHALSCFLLPPSWEVVEARLRGRGTEAEASIARRLEAGRRELARAHEFDAAVVNDDLSAALDDLSALYRATQLSMWSQRDALSRIRAQAAVSEGGAR
jgi:guanylate kinase